MRIMKFISLFLFFSLATHLFAVEISNAEFRRLVFFIVGNEAPPQNDPLFLPYASIQVAQDFKEISSRLLPAYPKLDKWQVRLAVKELKNTYRKEKEGTRAIAGYGFSEFSATEILIRFTDALMKSGFEANDKTLMLAGYLAERAVDIRSFKNIKELEKVVAALEDGVIGKRYQIRKYTYAIKQDEVNERAYEIAKKSTVEGQAGTLTRERWNNANLEQVKFFKVYAFMDIMFGGYTKPNGEGIAENSISDFLRTRGTKYGNILLDTDSLALDKLVRDGNALMEKITPLLRQIK